MGTELFLKRLKERGHWNNDYDYSHVEYKNAHTKIKVICKIMVNFSLLPNLL